MREIKPYKYRGNKFTYDEYSKDDSRKVTIYNCIVNPGFDSRDCKYRDYDEYNFAKCIINNKRKPCLKKECPKFK